MIDEALTSYLTTQLVGTQIYATRLPQSPVFPAIVFNMINSDPYHSLQGYAGLTTSRFQFDCWGNNKRDAVNLAESLRLILDGFYGDWGSYAGVVALRINQFDGPAEPTQDGSDSRYFRVVAEYEISYAESIPSFLTLGAFSTAFSTAFN